MALEQIPIGRPFDMIQNTIYACPAAKTTLFTLGAPTIFQSTDPAFGTSKALTLDTNNEAVISAPFLRCTSAGPQPITLKRD